MSDYLIGCPLCGKSYKINLGNAVTCSCGATLKITPRMVSASQSQEDYLRQLIQSQADLAAERDDARLWARRMMRERDHLQSQIDKLANWFMSDHSDLIRDGGAVDNAIRLLQDWSEDKSYRDINRQLEISNAALRKENEQVEALFNLTIEDINKVKAENAALRRELETIRNETDQSRQP